MALLKWFIPSKKLKMDDKRVWNSIFLKEHPQMADIRIKITNLTSTKKHHQQEKALIRCYRVYLFCKKVLLIFVKYKTQNIKEQSSGIIVICSQHQMFINSEKVCMRTLYAAFCCPHKEMPQIAVRNNTTLK